MLPGISGTGSESPPPPLCTCRCIHVWTLDNIIYPDKCRLYTYVSDINVNLDIQCEFET